MRQFQSFVQAFGALHEIDRTIERRLGREVESVVHEDGRVECAVDLRALQGASFYWSLDLRAVPQGGNPRVHVGIHWNGRVGESYVQLTRDLREGWYVTSAVFGEITPEDLFVLAGDIGVERNRSKRLDDDKAHERLGMIVEFAKRRL